MDGDSFFTPDLIYATKFTLIKKEYDFETNFNIFTDIIYSISRSNTSTTNNTIRLKKGPKNTSFTQSTLSATNPFSLNSLATYHTHSHHHIHQNSTTRSTHSSWPIIPLIDSQNSTARSSFSSESGSGTDHSTEEEDIDDSIFSTGDELPPLRKFFEQGNEPDFFQTTFFTILNLALRFDELFPTPIKPLTCNDTLVLNEVQARCLLSHAVLCSFSRRDYHTDMYSPFSFFRLFSEEPAQYKFEKLKMFFTYFRDFDPLQNHEITIAMQEVKQISFSADSPMIPFRFNEYLKDTDFTNVGIVSSGNKFLGGAPGGVFATGKMQEPIDFATHPEVIISQLVSPVMQDNVGVTVWGAAQYSVVENLGESVVFLRPTDQKTREFTRRQIWINIDSVDFRKTSKDYQFTQECIERQLTKLFVGMYTISQFKVPVVTGIWGGDAFGGDSELIFVQMWLAASLAKINGPTELIWLPNSYPSATPCKNDLSLKDDLTVKEVYSALQMFINQQEDLNCTLFNFLQDNLK